MSPTAPSDKARRRGLQIALVCAVVAFGMVGAAFAAVPLYRAFCQLTGFDGTVRRASAAPTVQLDRTLGISFDTNVNGVPLTFEPEKPRIEVKIGATGMAYFKVTNNSDRPVTGRAVYNVVPEQAGAYFQKLECFCFTEQTLQPHQTMEFPMIFFVDPGFVKDRDTQKFTDIALSYTFFPAEPAKAGATATKTTAAAPAAALGGPAKAGL
jgi:cytochrome c oxidase assembly protein subunit 11